MYELKIHDAAKEKPTRYKAMVWCADGYVSVLQCYEGHFNCSINSDGSLNTRSEITDVLYWADLPSLEDVRKMMEGENDA